jgi:glycosyltransferase involved in cell wall biosynthesis
MRRLKPDLVHAGSLKAGLYGITAARVAGVPGIWHVHDRIAPDYLPPIAARLLREAIAWLPDGVIANSRATLSTLALPRKAPPVRRVIAYPIETRPARPQRKSGPLTVGIVGRITEWKGQHVAIAGFARAFPAGDERLLVVGEPVFGDSEHRYEQEIRKLCERLEVSNRVDFRGFQEDVTRELASLDILVHASVIPEPFGQVIAEGMAAGLPVIATSVGGPAEILAPERSGLAYPAGDVDALAACLRRLAVSPALRQRLGQAGRERIREYAPRRIAEQMMEMYAETLKRSPRAHPRM